jgi:hypothetical protein
MSPDRETYDRGVDRASEDDPRLVARAKATEIASLSWEELDAHGKRTEEVVTPVGRRLRVKSIAFWDMEAWALGCTSSCGSVLAGAGGVFLVTAQSRRAAVRRPSTGATTCYLDAPELA